MTPGRSPRCPGLPPPRAMSESRPAGFRGGNYRSESPMVPSPSQLRVAHRDGHHSEPPLIASSPSAESGHALGAESAACIRSSWRMRLSPGSSESLDAECAAAAVWRRSARTREGGRWGRRGERARASRPVRPRRSMLAEKCARAGGRTAGARRRAGKGVGSRPWAGSWCLTKLFSVFLPVSV